VEEKHLGIAAYPVKFGPEPTYSPQFAAILNHHWQ